MDDERQRECPSPRFVPPDIHFSVKNMFFNTTLCSLRKIHKHTHYLWIAAAFCARALGLIVLKNNLYSDCRTKNNNSRSDLEIAPEPSEIVSGKCVFHIV